MGFYSAIKKNEILSYTGKWKELENIILNEFSQVQKAKAACLLLYVEYRHNTNTSNIVKNRLHSDRPHTREG
jgi:hypothetical protein